MKVGARVFIDAEKLKADYDLKVAGTIHLQYLAEECDCRPGDLVQMTKTHLNIDIVPSDWRLRITDWKKDSYTDDDVNYAAKTTQVSIELFKIFEEKLLKAKCSDDWKQFVELCSAYLNEEYPKQAPNIEYGKLPEPTIRVASTIDECKQVIEELRR